MQTAQTCQERSKVRARSNWTFQTQHRHSVPLWSEANQWLVACNGNEGRRTDTGGKWHRSKTAHAHAGFYIQSGCPKSKQTTNGSPLFSSLATLWNSHSCFSSASWDFSLAISYLFWYFPCPTTDDIYLKWNLDFSNQLAKSKFLGTIGRLKKSEVELQCLTSEGLKLGLVRITGEKFLKETEG